MNTYQQQLLEKLIAELTDKQSPNLHAAQMIAAELKGAMQATCKTCDGSQVIDSGGFTPWGEGINIACPECLSRSREAEIAQKPTPDADGWVENTGVDPDVELSKIKQRDGTIQNAHFASYIYRWEMSGRKTDITHYKPA